MLLVGEVDYYKMLFAEVGIDYYQFKTEDGKKRTMETIASVALPNATLVTEQEDGKFKWVYLFGSIAGCNYMLGRLKKEDEFAKHVLRVFRGFWASGAGILKHADS